MFYSKTSFFLPSLPRSLITKNPYQRALKDILHRLYSGIAVLKFKINVMVDTAYDL